MQFWVYDLLSILLDIGAQLNIWRIIAVSEKAQDVANAVLRVRYFLALLIVMGGLAFNIGNVGGAGLGLNILTGVSPEKGSNYQRYYCCWCVVIPIS